MKPSGPTGLRFLSKPWIQIVPCMNYTAFCRALTPYTLRLQFHSMLKLTFAVGNDEDCTHYGKDKGSNRQTECHKNITSDATP